MLRYLVLAIRKPEFDTSVVALHHAFLEELRIEERLEMSGPFTDKSGGAYLLRAASLDEATAIAERDPLHTRGASAVTVREWNAA